MSSAAAYRWGRMIARRRRLVLGVWVLVLIACAASYPGLKRSLGAPNYGIDGAESSRAAQLLERRFAGHGAEQDVLVFSSSTRRASEPAYRAVVARALLTARGKVYVKGVAGPYDRGARGQISRDGRAAIALVGIAGDPRQLIEHATRLQEAVDPLASAGVHVWLTGYSPVAKDITTVENEDVERAETIGVPIALLVLLLALGAAVAAVVPLAIAGSGLLLTYGFLAVLATMLTFDSFLTTIVTMIGVGIGIDYALFIVSRFREELARRGSPDGPVTSEQIEEAVGTAIASSGRTVLFSGVVVALALATLGVIRAPIYREFALGAVSVVVCTVIVALTLLPAVLALLGPRIDRGALPARMQPRDARAGASDGHGVWARWALAVMRHPVLAAGTIATVLLLAAVPLLSLRTGVDFGIASLGGTPSGKGERVLARSFGAGTLAPIEIVIAGRGDGNSPLDPAAMAGVARLSRELAPTAHNDIAAVLVTPGRDAALLTVAPVSAIDSYRSEQLVRHIRASLLPPIRAGGGLEIAVGGASAKIVDLSNETAAKVPLVLGLILALSLMFLTVVFRSVVLPVKAVVDEPARDGRDSGDRDLRLPGGSRRARAGVREHGLHPGVPAAVDLRAAVRPVDGLRGVPDPAHARDVARLGRQRARGRDRRRAHGPPDHGGGGDHGRGVRQLHHRERAGTEAIRPRPGACDRDRRDADPPDTRARADAPVRRPQLVVAKPAVGGGAETARAAGRTAVTAAGRVRGRQRFQHRSC